MNLEIQSIHAQGIELSARHRETEKKLISLIQDAHRLKVYRRYEYKNLHDYVTDAWKLSSHVAYTLIGLAMKSNEVPILKEKIEAEQIAISHARLIAPILSVQNQEAWIAKAETLSKRELEKEIKREFPEKAVREQARYVNESRLELKLGVDEAFMDKLKRVQDVVSQKTQSSATLEDALKEMAAFYLEKNDPIERAKRVKSDRKTFAPGQKMEDPSLIGFPVERAPIRADLKRQVILRDQGRCTRIEKSGQRCVERRWIDIHHKVPVYQGGENALENLTTLCRAHHRMVHK